MNEGLQVSKKAQNIFGDASGKKFKKLNARKWNEKEEEADIDTDDLSTDEDEEMQNEEIKNELNEQIKKQLNEEFAEATTNELSHYETSVLNESTNKNLHPPNHSSNQPTNKKLQLSKQFADHQPQDLSSNTHQEVRKPATHVPVNRPSHIEVSFLRSSR